MAKGNLAALTALQKKKTLAAAAINYRLDCNWYAEIEGAPADLDLYIQGVSYSHGTIESKKISIANGEMSFPDKRTAGAVTAVFYDNENGTVSDFIGSLQKKIFNEDGTANLPVEYLFKLAIYRFRNDASSYKEIEWDVYVEEDTDYSADNQKRERGTFSVTFQKFKSIGNPLP
jgi:hypothetical protein